MKKREKSSKFIELTLKLNYTPYFLQKAKSTKKKKKKKKKEKAKYLRIKCGCTVADHVDIRLNLNQWLTVDFFFPEGQIIACTISIKDHTLYTIRVPYYSSVGSQFPKTYIATLKGRQPRPPSSQRNADHIILPYFIYTRNHIDQVQQNRRKCSKTSPSHRHRRDRPASPSTQTTD